MLVLALASAALADPTLSITGACPGPATLEIGGASPGATVAILRGRGPGADRLGGGPCADTASGLDGLRLVRTFGVDAGGRRTLAPTLPPSACPAYLQVLDLDTCEYSDIQPVTRPDDGCGHLTAEHVPEGSQGQWCGGDALVHYTDYGAMPFDECQCLANATGTNWFGGESSPFPTIWIGDHDGETATIGGSAYWSDEVTVDRDASYTCALGQFDHRTEPSEFPIEELYTDADGRRWHFWQFSAQTHSQVISFADDVGGRVINPNSVGLIGTPAYTQPTHWCHAGAQFNAGGDCNSDNICNFVVGYFE